MRHLERFHQIADDNAHAVATDSSSTQSVNGEQPPTRTKAGQRTNVHTTGTADAS